MAVPECAPVPRLAVLFAGLAALAAPQLAGAQSSALAEDRTADRALLLRAIPGRMFARHGSRPEVRAVWRWSPASGAPLLLWSACNGAGDLAVCVVGVGRPQGARVRVMGVTPAGATAPTLRTTATATRLELRGTSGRCAWSRTIDLRGTGSVRISRARCDGE